MRLGALARVVTWAFVVGVFVGCGWLARRGAAWAYITGMVLYLLDGLAGLRWHLLQKMLAFNFLTEASRFCTGLRRRH